MQVPSNEHELDGRNGTLLPSCQVSPTRPRSHNGWLTKYALLAAAARELPSPISKRQLAAYIEWGMVGEPDDGLWHKGVVGRLVQVHKAGEAARRLERRAILVGTQKPEKRLQAMVWLAQHMSARKLKAMRLERAFRAWASEPAPRDAFGNRTYRFNPLPADWFFPDPERWPETLLDPLTADRFHTMSWSQSYFVDNLLSHSDAVPVLKAIKREELILLLTIRALSLEQHMLRRRSEQSQTPEAAANDLGGNRTREVPPHADQPYPKLQGTRKAPATASTD